MHILLTDLLACPRCGAEHGLIVLADRLEGRQVLEGQLGCANCREEYPIQHGVVDLRYGENLRVPPADEDPERALRAAALLGVADTPGPVLLLGAPLALAEAVAALLPECQVIAVLEEGDSAAGGRIDWVRTGAALPVRSRSLRGVAALGEAPLSALAELARPLQPGARVVLDPAPSGAAAELASHGFGVLLEQEGVVVAAAP